MKTVDENCKQKAAQQPITYPSNEPIWDAFFRYSYTETKDTITVAKTKTKTPSKELAGASV